MIIVIHELGHYTFCILAGGDPVLGITDKGDFCVRHDRGDSLLVGSGGLIFNLTFLPIFVGMGIFGMGPLPMVLLIIGGSLVDLIKIMLMIQIDT